ncbi:class F sortase [Streptacidiphilus sp. PB12-B1b]|nr:class F sortase [Streptacidiphilus sp. PB12-B1b]QMU80389.1 class F sortase [Streptacidiphilus sp. PB12-B1b]
MTVLAAGAGAWMVRDGLRTSAPPQPSAWDAVPATASPGTSGSAVAPGGPQVAAMPTAAPVRISIPSIGVDAPVTGEGLGPDRRLNVPPDTDRNLAGWYQDGPTPGSAGNAIMLGHVDTFKGPAVFYGLGAMHKGQQIDVTRNDHSIAVFSVDAIAVYQKDDFPSQKVYGPTTRPELRLITCGGGYTASTGYLGNVVVYAHLTGKK